MAGTRIEQSAQHRLTTHSGGGDATPSMIELPA